MVNKEGAPGGINYIYRFDYVPDLMHHVEPIYTCRGGRLKLVKRLRLSNRIACEFAHSSISAVIIFFAKNIVGIER